MIANRTIKTFPDSALPIFNGRYGPYITDGERNGKIPKDRDPASLTQAECEALLAEGKPVRKGGRFARKTPAKKAARATKAAGAEGAAPAKKAVAKAAKTAAPTKATKATKKTARKTAKKAAKKAARKTAAGPA